MIRERWSSLSESSDRSASIAKSGPNQISPTVIRRSWLIKLTIKFSIFTFKMPKSSFKWFLAILILTKNTILRFRMQGLALKKSSIYQCLLRLILKQVIFCCKKSFTKLTMKLISKVWGDLVRESFEVYVKMFLIDIPHSIDYIISPSKRSSSKFIPNYTFIVMPKYIQATRTPFLILLLVRFLHNLILLFISQWSNLLKLLKQQNILTSPQLNHSKVAFKQKRSDLFPPQKLILNKKLNPSQRRSKKKKRPCQKLRIMMVSPLSSRRSKR